MENNLNLPWYSSLTTGILELDIQHGNIDMMMQIFNNSIMVDKQFLKQLFFTIETHFYYEEQLLGASFPIKHRHEHKEFLLQFQDEESKLLARIIDKEHFIRVLGIKLKRHVTNYDAGLKSILEKTTEREQSTS